MIDMRYRCSDCPASQRWEYERTEDIRKPDGWEEWGGAHRCKSCASVPQIEEGWTLNKLGHRWTVYRDGRLVASCGDYAAQQAVMRLYEAAAERGSVRMVAA